MMSPKILSLHALAFSSTVVLSLGMHSTPRQLQRNIVGSAASPIEDRMKVDTKIGKGWMDKKMDDKLLYHICIIDRINTGI